MVRPPTATARIDRLYDDGALGTVALGSTGAGMETFGKIAFDQHNGVAVVVAPEDLRCGDRTHLVTVAAVIVNTHSHFLLAFAR